MTGMKATLTQLQITIHAGSLVPSGAHSRSLRPFRVEFAATETDKSLRLQIDAAGPWSSVEPVTMGPEKALWDNLHGTKVLHTDKYKYIKFSGTYRVESPTSIRVEGRLTVRDRTVPVQFSAPVQAHGETVTVTGEIPIRLSDVGIAKFKAMLGTLWLEDNATITVAVTAPARALL